MNLTDEQIAVETERDHEGLRHAFTHALHALRAAALTPGTALAVAFLIAPRATLTLIAGHWVDITPAAGTMMALSAVIHPGRSQGQVRSATLRLFLCATRDPDTPPSPCPSCTSAPTASSSRRPPRS